MFNNDIVGVLLGIIIIYNQLLKDSLLCCKVVSVGRTYIIVLSLLYLWLFWGKSRVVIVVVIWMRSWLNNFRRTGPCSRLSSAYKDWYLCGWVIIFHGKFPK